MDRHHHRHHWTALTLLILSSLFIIFSLSLPLAKSFTDLRQFQQLKDTNYANATVRTVSNYPSWFFVFGPCHAKITYEFTLTEQIMTGADLIRCSDDATILAGNTVPVYYDPQDPTDNISGLTLAAEPSDIFYNVRLGLISTIALIIIWAIYRYYHDGFPKFTGAA